MYSSGRIWLASLLVLFVALVSAGCDSSENPALLNPSPPDSTRVRVVNLIPDEPVTVLVAGVPVTTSLPSLAVSDFRNFLNSAPVPVLVRRSRTDTLKGQQLTAGSRTTYFVTGTRDTTLVIPHSTSVLAETTLRESRMARLVLINAIPDSAYVVRVGCEGGDSLFASTLLGNSLTRELPPSDLSLYLAPTGGGSPVASARITLTAGTVHYLIAARVGGSPSLLLLAPSSGSLVPAPPETRAQAAVQVLNGLPAGVVSATLGTTQIASGLEPLALSSLTDINACGSNGGDTLQVTPAFGAPISSTARFQVGSRSTVVVYQGTTGVGTIMLRRDNPPGDPGRIYLRAINLLPTIPTASIEAGAGAPDSVQPEKRLFGLIGLGGVTTYQELPEGRYPLIIKDASSGGFLGGGVGTLAAGYYTLFIVSRNDQVVLMISRDDASATTLEQFGEIGAQVRLFNLMPDADAAFVAGGLTLPPIAYSYVRSTLLPATPIVITSNAGEVAVDLSRASYTVGATGTAGNRSLIAIAAIPSSPPVGMASVRFLNVVPGSSELVIHSGGNSGPEIARTSFGMVSAAVDLDERKYAFVATSPSDTTTLAQANGLELTEGRRYLFIIGPKRSGTSGGPAYEVLWMQE